MRYEENGKSEVLAKLVEKVDDLCLNRYVKCRDRLVGDDHIGAHDNRTRNTDSLTLTARELVRITTCVLAYKTNELKDLVNLLLKVLLVLDSVDNESLGDDLLNCHTGVKRSDGVLEDHLDLGYKLGLLSNANVVLVLLLQLCDLHRIFGSRYLSVIILLELCNERSCIISVAVLVVVVSRSDRCLVLGNYLSKLCLLLGNLFLAIRLVFSLELLYFSGNSLARGLDGLLVGKSTCRNALALEINVSGGNVIDLDDRTSCGGLSASRLSNEAEYLALVDIKAYVIYRLVDVLTGFEILTKVFNS